LEGILSLILVLVILGIGILYCFWGYKYLKAVILIYVFIGGFLFMYSLLGEIAPDLGNGIWLISAAVGIVLALIAFFFIKFCIFVAGGIAGILIFNIIRSVSPESFADMQPAYIFLIGLIFFIVMGAITLLAQKHLVILFSAFIGAYSLVSMAGIFIGLIIAPDVLRSVKLANAITQLEPTSIFANAPSWVMFLPIVVFAIAGIISQYKFTSRKRR